MKYNILVLGHTGMLGHMVVRLLNNKKNIQVKTTNFRFPNWKTSTFKDIDFVINCIGAIPQKTSNFDINWKIPIWLEENTNCKIIHPSTDCEIDDDDYGRSKRKAANFISKSAKNTKMLQTSIIGPELNSQASLFEWFLSQKGKVYGYTKAIWNGVTTLEWAKFCFDLILNWGNYNTLTILSGNSVSKYELLNIIKDVYKKNDVIILKKSLGKDKTLKNGIRTKNIKDQLIELKDFEMIFK